MKSNRNKVGNNVLMYMLMDSAPSWLSESYTLIQLHDEKELVQLPRFFCARTWDSIYVADDNIVTIWRKRSNRSYARAHVTYWDDIYRLPECNTLQFSYDLFIPPVVARFHNSVDSLVTLSQECGSFFFDLADRILGGSSYDELRRLKDNLLADVGEAAGDRFQNISTASC